MVTSVALRNLTRRGLGRFRVLLYLPSLWISLIESAEKDSMTDDSVSVTFLDLGTAVGAYERWAHTLQSQR